MMSDVKALVLGGLVGFLIVVAMIATINLLTGCSTKPVQAASEEQKTIPFLLPKVGDLPLNGGSDVSNPSKHCGLKLNSGAVGTTHEDITCLLKKNWRILHVY